MAGMLKLAILVILSLTALIFFIAALILPYWGYYDDSISGFGISEIGYFTPWRTCKVLHHFKEKCGEPRIRMSDSVFFSGIATVISTICVAISSFLTTGQLIKVGNRKPAIFKNSSIVLVTLLAALCSIMGLILFLIQGDDLQRGFRIKYGPSFYFFLVGVLFSNVLFVITIFDYMNVRKRDRTSGSISRNTQIRY